MSEAKKPRRLSDIRVAGRDYPAKVKIEEILDSEVELTQVDHVVITKKVMLPNGDEVEVEDANYFNLTILQKGLIKTFSTSAVPIVKIVETLTPEELPVLCTFRKSGRTYIVE